MGSIKIEIDNQTVLGTLDRLFRTTGDLRPVLKVIGEDILKSTEERFNSQGPAPDGKAWPALSAATLKHKRHPKILTESGQLRGSVRYQLLDPNTLAIGTNKKYGAIHQLGGKAGRGHKVKIPARPYLGISRNDETRIVNIGERFLQSALR